MLRHDSPVDPREAEEIVRLAAQRQGVLLNEGPTVNGLAEALGLPPEEVERLLAEVRSRRSGSATSERRFGDRSAALSAAIVLALVLVVGIVGFGGFMMVGQRPVVSPPVMTLRGPGGETVEVNTGEGVAEAADVAPPAPMAPTPVVPSEEEIEAMRRSAENLRQSLANAQSAAERARVEAALKQAQDQLKSEMDKAHLARP